MLIYFSCIHIGLQSGSAFDRLCIFRGEIEEHLLWQHKPWEKSISFSTHVQTKKSKWIVTRAKSQQTAKWLAHQLAKVFVCE